MLNAGEIKKNPHGSPLAFSTIVWNPNSIPLLIMSLIAPLRTSSSKVLFSVS